MRTLVFAVLLGITPARVHSQYPSTVIPEALRSLVSGPGSCSGVYTPSPAVFSYFPAVVFTRAECVAEHGDSATAIVGIDSSGVLYLLESREAFNFLVDRHPPYGLDSLPSVAYAMAAVELSGKAAFPIHLVKDRLQLPPSARRTIEKVQPWQVQHGPYVWTVGFVTVSPTFDGPYAISWAVTIAHGKLVLVERTPD